jgi:acyl-coenzyme A synthetase/AMP-(fatty) acid ligase/acyl carrier protein
VNLGGESVARRDLRMCWSNVHEDAVVVNSYGSTETKLIAQYYADRLSAVDLETVPVGYEAPDTRVILLDEHGKEVEPGVTGEIVVQSRFIARGYWRSSEDRNTGFATASEGNGLYRYCTGDLGRRTAGYGLVHLGRKDDQVKLRGYRVNLREIESVLTSHPDVGQVVVIVENAERDTRRLVAVYTERADRDLFPDGLRGMAEERLPDYMVPARFVVFDEIPVGENGKIDRTAVLRLLADPTAGEKSRDSGAGNEFVDMIADVLGIDAIARDDNFVDIGGDSLTAAQVVIRIEREYGVRVRASQVLESPTISVIEDSCRTGCLQQNNSSDAPRCLSPTEWRSQ